MKTTHDSHLSRAAAILGSQTKLALACDVSPQAVCKWLKLNQPPIKRCRQIEAATNGRVTRLQLRPDHFGSNSFAND